MQGVTASAVAYESLHSLIACSVNTEPKIYALLISSLYLLSSHYLFPHFQKKTKMNYYRVCVWMGVGVQI